MNVFDKIAKTEQAAIEKLKAHKEAVRVGIAKLMSAENLYVQHSNVPTAAFNTKDRVLHLPVWKEGVSDDLYRLMITHEVGHALFTPSKGWEKEATSKAMKFVLNVVEDARIERMILARYPGNRR